MDTRIWPWIDFCKKNVKMGIYSFIYFINYIDYFIGDFNAPSPIPVIVLVSLWWHFQVSLTVHSLDSV